MNNIFFSLLLILIFSIKSLNANENKVVFIDMDLLFKDSIVGLSINKQINDFNKKKQKQINILENEIKKENELINSQKNILSDEEVKKKIEVFNEKLKKYNSQIQNNQKILNEARMSASNKDLDELKPILSEYSNKNSISLILQKKNLIIGKNDLDITKDIIEILNKKIKSIKIDF